MDKLEDFLGHLSYFYCINPEGRIHLCIKLELHVYDETSNLVNFVLMALTDRIYIKSGKFYSNSTHAI